MDDARAAYERHALNFLFQRDKSDIGSKTVEAWSKTLRPGARGIELACGGGVPISRTLLGAGLELWAVDGSPTLARAFRSRFPGTPIQCSNVLESDFFDLQFEFAIAIGLLFLLDETDQVTLVSRVADRLTANGRFLLTAPIETGTWIDINTGIQCRSLGQARYQSLFEQARLKIHTTYLDSGGNHYFDLSRE